MYTKKLRGKKRGKSKKRYSKKGGVLNRPKNMSSLRVNLPVMSDYHGVDTTRRKNKSKKELINDLQILIKQIEDERDEIKREKLEKELKIIAEAIAKY